MTDQPDVGPIVLVGMMGTGKSTVGRLVARSLGRAFYDSDAMIEARRHKTVAQLWEEGGEPAYRALETDVLGEALDARPAGVVAAAGGVVLAQVNRAVLRRVSERGGVVVWLRAAPEVLAGRVHPGDHRPLLREDPEGTLRRLAADRAAWYAEVADRVIDVGPMTADAVAQAVLAEVEAHAGAHR